MFTRNKDRVYIQLRRSWLSVRVVSPHVPAKTYDNDTNVVVKLSIDGIMREIVPDTEGAPGQLKRAN